MLAVGLFGRSGPLYAPGRVPVTDTAKRILIKFGIGRFTIKFVSAFTLLLGAGVAQAV
jgi:hypothetical protein